MPEPSSSHAPAPPASGRKGWRQRLLDWVVHQLTQGITPQKLALTLALGTACGLFPIVGTTTLLCFAAGIIFRLNQPAIQIVNGVCTPVHVPVILGLYHFGNSLYHVPRLRHAMHVHFLSNMFWVFWDTPRLFFRDFGLLTWRLVVAWAILAPVWIALVYFTTLPVLREVERRRRDGALR
ncbi:MAG: DUF2062 domain-containing protein [Opitutaceae bacterium]